jgi:DNA-binding CsgD family transcriptional regulator
MPTVDIRVATWLDVVAELLRDPLTTLPTEAILAHLLDTFETEVVSFNWRRANGQWGLTALTDGPEIRPGLPLDRAVASWLDLPPEMLDYHPLIRWFTVTGDPAAQTWGRVPDAIAASERVDEVAELMVSYDLSEQMSIPVGLDGQYYEAFVLGRGGQRDFGNEDVTVARRIQPALTALRHQVDVLADSTVPDREGGALDTLTGREQAVLCLLAQGLTAVAIGRRLSVSPRTVSKHVEHIYRKLSVHDRLGAVRIADAAGLRARRPPLLISPNHLAGDGGRQLLGGPSSRGTNQLSQEASVTGP